jgi:excinuclease ABC subunit A
VLRIEGAREHNLQRVDVEFPLGLFVAVTGVSGSGKSTLVEDILQRTLSRHFFRARVVPGGARPDHGLEHLDKVIDIDQTPIGRTPRSNPATYTGLFTPIRELFAEMPEAKIRGYGPGRFSFNVKGGRCEACQGDGLVKIEMHFLPDVYVPCECARASATTARRWTCVPRAEHLAEVLDLTVEDAHAVFENQPRIHQKLVTLNDVGLGYIHLGQSATTLSGGEAQRVKLATELSQARHRAHALHPRRAHHGAALRGRARAARRPAQARGPRQHGAGDRAQPRRHQDGRLDRGPGAGGWVGGRDDRRGGHAGAGGQGEGVVHRAVPGEGRSWRP